MASRSSTSGSRTASSVPGEPIILVADTAGRIESFVSALGRGDLAAGAVRLPGR